MPCVSAIDVENILYPRTMRQGIQCVYTKAPRTRLTFQLCENEDTAVTCTHPPRPNYMRCGVYVDREVHSSVAKQLQRIDSILAEKYALSDHERMLHIDETTPGSGWVFFDASLPRIYRMTIEGCIVNGELTHITRGARLIPHVCAYYHNGPTFRMELKANVILVIPRATHRWNLVRRAVKVRPYALHWLLCHANSSEEKRIERAKRGVVEDDPLSDVLGSM